MIIIIPGHYQEKSSLNSERPTIIRVLGPDNEKEGYSLLQDGKKIPDYVIDSEYVLLDTSSTEKPTNKKPPASIFADFEEVQQPLESEQKIKQQKNKGIVSSPSQVVPANSTHLNPVVPMFESNRKELPKIQTTQIQELPFDISVIEKINIDNMNKKSMENLGIQKYKKPVIDITIPVKFDYDIDKLKHTIELLELDEGVIIDYLVKKIQLDSIETLLKHEIKKLLSYDENIDEKMVFVESVPLQTMKTPLKSVGLDVLPVVSLIQPLEQKEFISTIIPSPVAIEIELEQGISEVSQYLNTII